MLASGSADDTTRLQNVNDHKCTKILEGPTMLSNSLCLVKASGSWENTIRLWNLNDYNCI